MKTLIRTIVWLALVVWLGGLFFFPITAWAAFSSIADTHAAGTVVAKSLGVLHHEGLFAGCILVLFIAIGVAARVYRRTAFIGIAVTLIMLGLTAFSQFSIIPRMEKDRIAAGGAIDSVPPTDPRHADFNRLHHQSEHLEEAVMLCGIILVVVLAREN
ncbi:MAG TPA: hypothetical protein VHX37_10850 [Acidobacteriaceae bacterium]|jgi:hypothetical protein|nr:hypothetical protein [Acidobacteriaceae bacterium]